MNAHSLLRLTYCLHGVSFICGDISDAIPITYNVNYLERVNFFQTKYKLSWKYVIFIKYTKIHFSYVHYIAQRSYLNIETFSSSSFFPQCFYETLIIRCRPTLPATILWEKFFKISNKFLSNSFRLVLKW